MIEKLNIFKNYDITTFYEQGFSDECCELFYMVSPYLESHGEITRENCLSYSYVLNGMTDYRRYVENENKIVAAFEELYSKYDLLGLKFEKDKYYLIEYRGFLSFKDDLIKGLREDTSYNFLIDSLGLVIDCNFDLSIAILGYQDADLSEILEVFRARKMLVTKVQ